MITIYYTIYDDKYQTTNDHDILRSNVANGTVNSKLCETSPFLGAIFKTRNGESGNGNGERGTGNGERGIFKSGESLKAGIFKMGNL